MPDHGFNVNGQWLSLLRKTGHLDMGLVTLFDTYNDATLEVPLHCFGAEAKKKYLCLGLPDPT